MKQVIRLKLFESVIQNCWTCSTQQDLGAASSELWVLIPLKHVRLLS